MSSDGFALDKLFSISNLHVAITGGATGLGLSIAKGFVSNGAIIHIIGRRQAVLENGKARLLLMRPDAEIHTHCFDISDLLAVQAFASSLSRLDVLINSAGIVTPDSPSHHLLPIDELQQTLLSSPCTTWSSTFDTNVSAPYYMSVSVLHLLASSQIGGRIINISSIGSVMSDPAIHQPAYQVSKTALNHLTRLLASKFRDIGVKVNAIAPGYFPSAMNNPDNPRSMVARAKDLVPVKRAGEEEDIAGTAIWLASRAGSYVNGEVIMLGGGREWA